MIGLDGALAVRHCWNKADVEHTDSRLIVSVSIHSCIETGAPGQYHDGGQHARG
ncbi:hypothetical protein [Paenibacillus wenxiniae]|uniref:Uncharacterized protein n=1 Tax=Paenibacillus wenxiniae TaxID=1636843 RepID=A0ABW4RLF7_9BACL